VIYKVTSVGVLVGGVFLIFAGTDETSSIDPTFGTFKFESLINILNFKQNSSFTIDNLERSLHTNESQ